MIEQILELVKTFDAQISDYSMVTNAKTDVVFLDFENDLAWASFSYKKDTLQLVSASVESKDRKYYYQLMCKNSTYELDTDAIELEVYEDYLEKASAIWKGEDFDKRVVVEIELDDDIKDDVLRACAAQGISIDEFFERLMKTIIQENQDQ